MTKSFDEWFKDTMRNTHKGVGSKKIETFGYETAQDAWNFKQAEVDELQKRIDETMKMLAHGDGYGYEQCTRLAINILKGGQL